MSDRQTVAITHHLKGHIGDNGRSVELLRADNGCFRFEWQRPEENSAAMLSTKVWVHEDAFFATA